VSRLTFQNKQIKCGTETNNGKNKNTLKNSQIKMQIRTTVSVDSCVCVGLCGQWKCSKMSTKTTKRGEKKRERPVIFQLEENTHAQSLNTGNKKQEKDL